MYAVEATVRALIRNKVSPTANTDIALVGSGLADPEIDSALGNAFYWPLDSEGTDISASPPAAIRMVANLLTASLIEDQAYAQNEAGAQRNPYAASLERRARGLLARIVSGEIAVDGLENRAMLGSMKMAAAASDFSPVSGFNGRGR